MRKKLENIFNRLPFFKGNTLQVNLIVLLSVFTYIVISIDLQTEMAVEKDEIASVVVILEQSLDSTVLDEPVISNINFQLLGIIPVTSTHKIHEDILTCLKDRSPPVQSEL